MIEQKLPKQYKDFTGQTYGRLTVVSFSHVHVQASGNKKTKWNCKCVCGNVTVVTGCSLSTGATQSCGCLQKERAAIVKISHGMTDSTTYKTWLSMKERCTNANSKTYPAYGGKGVKVCDRWLESFENFLEDMGERPEGKTLNRISSVPLYSKETCEWADMSLQGYDQKLKNTNKSGKTGVCWAKSSGKWQAYIMKDKKQINLGFYSDYDEAVSKRKEAELKYYGFTKE